MGGSVLARRARFTTSVATMSALLAVVVTATSTSVAISKGPRASFHTARDRDGDGLPDRWERRYGLSTRHDSSLGDPDHDSLSNRAEYRLRLNPRRWDTDGDGLSDGREVKITRTDPRRKDSDGDGVSDGREVALGS